MLAQRSCADQEEYTNQGSRVRRKEVATLTKSEDQILLRQVSQGETTAFWQLWGRHQNYLYSRCLTWMGGNHADAEEALSQATLKACEKWQDYAGKITNPKAWLTQLTRNLCMDMHRERNRGARGVESLENIAEAEHECAASSIPSPESEVVSRERDIYVRRAIDALPAKLHTPFILRYEEEMSYPEIAQKLALSSEKVRKLVQQARTTLQKQLNKYFSGLDDSSPVLDSLFAPHPPACGTPLKKGGKEGTPGGWEDFAPPEARGVGGDRRLETPISAACTTELINYKVTATCLEVLSHTWYSSPSCLGWR